MTEKRVIIVSLSIFILIAALLIFDKYRVRDIEWASITEQQRALLVSGDVVFTEGNSFKSDIVRIASGTREGQHFSHCGVITTAKDEVYVVHMSIEEGMIIKEPIEDFWSSNKVTSYAVCRVEGFYEIEAIEEELNNLIADEVPFDNSYNASQNQELYCTELICYLFEKVSNLNLYPTENLREFIYPNDLFEIDILKKIY